MSLADMQLLTQVSLPTLRKAVQQLTDARWIRVVGQSEANGGRPPMLYGLDDSYFVVLGVHLQLPGIRLTLCDLSGNVLDELEVFEGTTPNPDEAVQAVINYTIDVRSRFDERQLIGIGIAAPGFTDPETGNIISIGRVLGWRDFPICRRLEEALDQPTQIANDVDCMAFAEFQHTGKSLENNLTYVGFDEGVKVSMFLNGELYKGSFGNAGLIMNRFPQVVNADVPADDQHQFLTLSGINTIFEREVANLTRDEQSQYLPMLQAGYRERLMMILQDAYARLPICQKLTNMLITVLASAVANTIYVIQPDTVVLGGFLSGMSDGTFTKLSAAIRENLPTLFANHIQIEQAQLFSPNTAALGAAHHFIERYLVPENFSISRPMLQKDLDYGKVQASSDD